MTGWRGQLEAHLAQLQPLLRRRTPVKFDGSPKAVQLKTEIQAWNRKAKQLLLNVPQGKKRLVAFHQLGHMTFTSLDAVREQLKRRQQLLQDVLHNAPAAPTPKKAGVIDRTQSRTFRYAFCLTFAGADRDFAAAVNAALRKRRQKTFFDQNKDARIRLLGEPGPDVLHAVFSEESELCLMFTSKAYKERMWTSIERVSAQARSTEQGGSYIIPIRLDATPIPGLAHTIGYLSNQDGVSHIVSEVIAKLKEARAERRTINSGSGQTPGPAAPSRRKLTGQTPERRQRRQGNAVLIGDRVYTAQEIKRASGITVTVRITSQEELSILRQLNTAAHSWKEIAFADVTGGEDVTVERYEENMNHNGQTTVQLHLKPNRQPSVSYGIPAAEAVSVVRHVLLGASHSSGWVSVPRDLDQGVIALAARTAEQPQDIALYARHFALYYLHKLRLLSCIQELTISKVGRQFRIRLHGTLNGGAFDGGKKMNLHFDERVAAPSSLRVSQ